MLIDGKKVACATCIKGHRATHCKHKDRPMVEIKQKGRPKTQCKQCRELRLVRQLHVKCNCGDDKQMKRTRSTISSNNEQEARIIKKVVMDLSNTNLRAIAPRPKEFQQQQQQQTLTLGPHLPSTSSSSPPRYTSYPSLSTSPPPLPPLSSPQQCSSNTIMASTPPRQYSSYSMSQSPPPAPPSNRYSSYPEPMNDSSPILSSTATPVFSTLSVCRCRPGNSCGCKKSDGSSGSCCGSTLSSQRPIPSSTPSASTSSCCGSASQAMPASSCGSAPHVVPTPSCCGSASPAPISSTATSTDCQSSSSSSLPALHQLGSETNKLTKSTSCCGSTNERETAAPSSTTGSYDTNNLYDSSPTQSTPPLQEPSHQSMLHPSAHLTLANGRTGTMCEDGIGKSSCCSSKQRNALGEIIRVVTCRCGDDCACIGCDAHPSRAMKSSQEDPYAGYTDLSIGRRRLSIAAICSNDPTTTTTTTTTTDSPSTLSSSSSSSSSATPPPPPSSSSSLLPFDHQHQQNSTIHASSSMDQPTPSRYDMMNKAPLSKVNDIPTSVLGEDGILLCGCGCSNTLDECTDCFQELCQDYYAGR